MKRDVLRQCSGSGISAPSLKWGVFKPQRLAENRAKCGFSHFLQVAGFVAIFNESNYSGQTSVNAGF